MDAIIGDLNPPMAGPDGKEPECYPSNNISANPEDGRSTVDLLESSLAKNVSSTQRKPRRKKKKNKGNTAETGTKDPIPENHNPIPEGHNANKKNQDSRPFLFLTFAQELRDLVYSKMYAAQDCADRRIVIEARRLSSLRNHSSLLVLVLCLGHPITRTNKQVALEFVEQTLRTECLLFTCGPDRLLAFFKRLDPAHLQWIKAIEMDWFEMPMDILSKFHKLEKEEISPLFTFIKMHTNITSVTVPLFFLAIRAPRSIPSSEVKVFRTTPYQVLKYWCVVGAYAIALLLDNDLDEVLMAIRPRDVWALVEPTLNVHDLANMPWNEWDLKNIECLYELEMQLANRMNEKIEIKTLIAAVEVQLWEDTEIGEELLITMRRPQSAQTQDDENDQDDQDDDDQDYDDQDDEEEEDEDGQYGQGDFDSLE
jgi:hypothetical protein